MHTFNCERCGALVEFDPEQQHGKCGFCRMVYNASPVEREQPLTLSQIKRPMLRRAERYLAAGDLQRAREVYLTVLDLDEREYRAHIGLLLLDLGLGKQEEIPRCGQPLEQSLHYEKILLYAPEPVREKFQQYALPPVVHAPARALEESKVEPSLPIAAEQPSEPSVIAVRSEEVPAFIRHQQERMQRVAILSG